MAGEWIDTQSGRLPQGAVQRAQRDRGQQRRLHPPTSAGFVQSFVYGLTGLRINDQGLSQAYAPVLPPQGSR